jgi:hypothetical protein
MNESKNGTLSVGNIPGWPGSFHHVGCPYFSANSRFFEKNNY